MTSAELKRWLEKQGCTFEAPRGGSSHFKVYLGEKRSFLPMHGKKEMKRGTVEAIKKQLGLR
jgi:mRNA interferase HicA